jgi:hypothetical protein
MFGPLHHHAAKTRQVLQSRAWASVAGRDLCRSGTSPYGTLFPKSDFYFMATPQPVGRPEVTILLRIISVFGINSGCPLPYLQVLPSY